MDNLFLDDDDDDISNNLVPTKNEFKPEILNVQISAKWEWANIYNIKCSICREYLFETSENINSFCVIGECNHGFHNDCIIKYHKSSNCNQCPLCNNKWIPKNNLN